MSLAEVKLYYARPAGMEQSPLLADLSGYGSYGAIGTQGISPVAGFPRGIIDDQGWFKRRGGDPYLINAETQPGALYRVQIMADWRILATIVFPPIATDGVIDIAALLASRPDQTFSVSHGVEKAATFYPAP